MVMFVNLRPVLKEAMASLCSARQLGCEVALLTDRVPPWAEPLVGDVELADTYDLDALVEAARRLQARTGCRGVVTWSDRDVEGAAHVAAALDLPGPTPEAARRVRNKYVMRRAVEHLGVAPRFVDVRSPADARDGLREIGTPAILKPAGASGSKGIFEIRGPEDLEAACERALAVTTAEFDPIYRYYPQQLILEEFVEGAEFSVEGLVAGGVVHVVGVTDKWTTVPFHLEYQHVHPTRLAAAERETIERGAVEVVRALGLDHCAFHLECKLEDGRFRLIEVAGRIGGDYIDSHLVPLSTGVDFYGAVIQVAVGEEPTLEPRPPVPAGVRFVLAGGPGRLAGFDGLERALQHEAVEHVIPELPIGAQVELPPRAFTAQRTLAVIARHPDAERLVRFLEEEVGRGCTARVAGAAPVG